MATLHELNILFEAARAGDDSVVLSYVPTFDSQNKYEKSSSNVINALTATEPSSGQTALHFAASNGHLRLVRALLESGMPVDVVDNLRKTPAMHAASNEHLSCVEVLLSPEFKANIDHQDVTGQTLLHRAVFTDNSTTSSGQQLIDLLLARGASVDVEDRLGKTPMFLAKSKGRGKIVEQLYSILRQQKKQLAITSSNGSNALSVAGTSSSSFDPELIRKLFSIVKSRNPDIQLLQQLLEEHKGVALSALDPDDKAERKNLLHTVCNVGVSLDAAKLLIEKFSCPIEAVAAGGLRLTPLAYACRAYFDFVDDNTTSKESENNENDRNQCSQSLAMGINLNLIEYLLKEQHANLNAIDINGQTVLHRACSVIGKDANKSLIQLLLKYDVDVDIQDYKFKTALDIARVKGKTSVVSMIQNHVDRQLRIDNNPSLISAKRARMTLSPTRSKHTPDFAETETKVSQLEKSQHHIQRELLGARNEIERLRMELEKSREEAAQLRIRLDVSERRNQNLVQENEELRCTKE